MLGCYAMTSNIASCRGLNINRQNNDIKPAVADGEPSCDQFTAIPEKNVKLRIFDQVVITTPFSFYILSEVLRLF